MEKKALTIKDVALVDIEKFKQIKEETGFTPAKTFSHILNAEKSNVNQVNTNGLQEQVNELMGSLRDLEQVNQSLLDEKTSLLEENKTLFENNKAVNLQLEEEKNGKQLTGTQFIFEPTEMQAKKMQRSIAYLKNKGNLDLIKKEKYLQHFTSIALEYLINNEFNHILK